jgi:hypothetical protein
MSDSAPTSEAEDGSVPLLNMKLSGTNEIPHQSEEESNLIDQNNLHKSIRKRNPRQCLAPGCNKCSQGNIKKYLYKLILIFVREYQILYRSWRWTSLYLSWLY